MARNDLLTRRLKIATPASKITGRISSSACAYCPSARPAKAVLRDHACFPHFRHCCYRLPPNEGTRSIPNASASVNVAFDSAVLALKPGAGLERRTASEVGHASEGDRQTKASLPSHCSGARWARHDRGRDCQSRASWDCGRCNAAMTLGRAFARAAVYARRPCAERQLWNRLGDKWGGLYEGRRSQS